MTTEILLRGAKYEDVKAIERYTYGISVVKTDNGVKVIISSHSGVRPEYYELAVKRLMEMGYDRYVAEKMARHNQLLIPVLLALIGAGGALAYAFTHGTQIRDFMIILATLIGIGVAVYLISRR